MNYLRIKGRYYAIYPPEPEKMLGYTEEELMIEIEKSAFLLVDVYGLGFDEGEEDKKPFYFSKKSFLEIKEIIRNHIRPSLDAARKAGLHIIYVTNYSPRIADNRGEFGKLSLRCENFNVEKLFAPGSDLLKYSKVIKPRPYDYQIFKQMYSGFFETPLESLLKNLEIKNLISVGFDGNVCLLTTLIDAFYRNYRVILLRDCTLAGEHHDTADAQLNTEFGIRYVEAHLGFSATSEDFITACKDICSKPHSSPNKTCES